MAVLKVIINRTVLRYKRSSLYRSSERSEFGLGTDTEDDVGPEPGKEPLDSVPGDDKAHV